MILEIKLQFSRLQCATVGIILLWLSAFLTLYTGYDYLRKGIDHAINEDSKISSRVFPDQILIRII